MYFSSVKPETIVLLQKIEENLAARNIDSYIVGGFVRDILLGRETADIDITVAGDSREIAESISAILGGRYVLLDDVNKVARVILFENRKSPDEASYVLDFSSFSETIEKDLARRDFTVDAMAVELSEFAKDFRNVDIIDPYNGKVDLDKQIIRAVSDEVFSEDSVRLLRAVRLAGELGFSIDRDTENLVKKDARLLAVVPGERIREELLRLLAIPGAGGILKYLDELKLLTAMIPELEESRGMEQPKEHHWDVLEHSFAAVNALEFLLGEVDWQYTDEGILTTVPRPDEIIEHLNQEVSSGSTRKSLLKLSALLHDVGKPGTKSIDETGRTRFLGHSKEGAILVAERLEKLRFSSREIKLIETEITHHMRPTQLSREGMPSNRAVYRYYRDTGQAGLDILFLNLADHLATRGPDLETTNWQEHIKLVSYLLEKYFEKENVVNPPKIIDGYDIIESFGLSPGPRIGELLDAVKEAQASGEIIDRDQALAYLKKLIA
ncbi:MAG: CCA tRNA nucleotidyltransferase [Dehalococcoidales bacterium]|nr:CCA tRNA nucleotidyltransferase [Dehalococcoidales bacterium]